MSILKELRRRNVFRVAAGYAVVAWLLAQAAGVLESGIGLPDWFDAVVISFLALGFPLALILAWAFEVTPDGVRRAEPGQGEAKGFRPADFVIVAGLALVCVLIVGNRLAPRAPTSDLAGAESPPPADPSAAASVPAAPVAAEDRSIAVLPFVGLSGDESDGYFGKGVAEELLNALAQFPDLKVAARTSAFAYDGQNVDLREVGGALGVAHVLEGSVRRYGDKLRVTAQLIRSSDGFHLWSETYDRELDDVFAIQDDIVAELNSVMQLRLGVGFARGRASAEETDPQAYDAYLRGLDLWWRRAEAGTNRSAAIDAFALATQIDPAFADAHAALGASTALSGTSTDETDAWRKRAKTALDRALDLDPDNARAHGAAAFLNTGYYMDPIAARDHADRALALAPGSAFAHYADAQVATFEGRYDAMMTAIDRTRTLDPQNATVRRVRASMLPFAGRAEAALAEFAAMGTCPSSGCAGPELAALIYGSYAVEAYGTEEDAAAYLRRLEAAVENAATPEFAELFSAELRVTEDLPDAVAALRRGERPPVPEAAGASNPCGWWCFVYDEPERVFTYYDRNPNVMPLQGATEPLYLLDDSQAQVPDAVRRDPRYHALWSGPGMQELARIRRENGQPYGLPLPVDGGEAP